MKKNQFEGIAFHLEWEDDRTEILRFPFQEAYRYGEFFIFEVPFMEAHRRTYAPNLILLKGEKEGPTFKVTESRYVVFYGQTEALAAEVRTHMLHGAYTLTTFRERVEGEVLIGICMRPVSQSGPVVTKAVLNCEFRRLSEGTLFRKYPGIEWLM